MRVSILILSLLYPFVSNLGQNISAQIKDSKTQLPIEYVNIGIVGKNIGTVSDSLGNFKLLVTNTLETDIIRVSAIGYSANDYKLKDFRATEFPKTILMDEEIIALKEVAISNEEYKLIQLGLKKKYSYPIPLYKKASSKVAFPQKGINHEIGTRFTNSKTIYLDSIQLNFAECNLDNLEVRINVYSIKNEVIKNKLRKPIYIKLTKEEALNFPIINIIEHNIEVESDFLITIENHLKIPQESLYFLSNTKSKGKMYPTYYRHSSQSDWMKLKSKKGKILGISILTFGH